MTLTPARLTLALAAAALGGGWLLMPGTAERLAMLARDGRFEAAMRVGERAVRAGDEDPQVLARLFDINSHEGDPARARAAIFRYLRERPDDLAMWWRAVEFLEEGDDLPGLKEALLTIIEQTRDPAATEKLARLHRLYGEFEAERALLAGARPEQLTPEMGWRAAGLLAQGGEGERAAALVRRLDDAEPAGDTERRLLAFDILSAAGAAGEAGERALRWTGMDAGERSLLVLQLALAGADEAALRLATAPGSAATGLDPAALAWTLGTRGHLALAEALIDTAARGATPLLERRMTRLYVDLALRTGSAGHAVARSHALLRDGDPARRARGTLLAATLFERQGYAGIAPLRPLLSGEALAGAPLFAATLSLTERNALAARVFLERVDLAALDETDARLWSTMALELFGPAATADLLDAHRRSGTLPATLLPSYAQAAARAGRFEPARPLLPPSPSPDSRKPQA